MYKKGTLQRFAPAHPATPTVRETGWFSLRGGGETPSHTEGLETAQHSPPQQDHNARGTRKEKKTHDSGKPFEVWAASQSETMWSRWKAALAAAANGTEATRGLVLLDIQLVLRSEEQRVCEEWASLGRVSSTGVSFSVKSELLCNEWASL